MEIDLSFQMKVLLSLQKAYQAKPGERDPDINELIKSEGRTLKNTGENILKMSGLADKGLVLHKMYVFFISNFHIS